MGADKWSIELGGSTFAVRVITAASMTFENVIVVTKPGRGQFTAPVIHESNVEVAAPIIGLDAALDHAAGEPCFVLGVDYPFMTADALSYLRRRFEASSAEIVVPEIGSKLHMLCAGYRATTSSSVKARIAEGRLALKGLVDAHETLIVTEREVIEHCGPGALMNVNTPAELDEARRIDAEAKGH